MPPPNQATGSPASGVAVIMRTFMCTVGAYGLRGWNTSDRPSASNGAPASPGRCCVAEPGSRGPVTCEKPQPARSNTAPSSRIMVMPLPCSGSPGSLAQGSCSTGLPSIADTQAMMACCSPRR